MPQLGTGIMPSGAAGTEVQYVTRRAFVPKMIVQIYNCSPFVAAAIANAQPASGGVSSVTVPVQGASFVNSQWTDYSGTFNQPSVQQGIQNAEYNLKALVVPIPFQGMEYAVQKDHAIIPLIEARMNDATNNACDAIGTALYNNTGNNQQLIGLPGAIDDSTNLATYGGISRTSNAFWKSKVYNAGATNPTRALVMQYISGTFKNCGELPSFGLMGVGTWQTLANDFLGQEVFNVSPGSAFDSESNGPRSAFRALMVAGVPIYCDPYCPEGILYLVNSNYVAMYIHENAAFTFSGFQSTIPNYQIGYLGIVLALMELVCVKPKANTRVSNFTYVTL
ncbi:phage major capsid protein [Paludibacterium sp.]|uniref:phage major capsid protein n=1 Tax=Paludibacterium sp. TaxID=1917523 RepID=UPI0025F06155|nr:phage major capsid protein [Paludibacterium sp.]MBV8648467.1 phage major capsid protein [Paludibacterium sp.]